VLLLSEICGVAYKIISTNPRNIIPKSEIVKSCKQKRYWNNTRILSFEGRVKVGQGVTVPFLSQQRI